MDIRTILANSVIAVLLLQPLAFADDPPGLIQCITGDALSQISRGPTTDTMKSPTFVLPYSKWVYVLCSETGVICRFERDAATSKLTYLGQTKIPSFSNGCYGSMHIKPLASGGAVLYLDFHRDVRLTEHLDLSWFKIDKETGDLTLMDSMKLKNQGGFLMSPDGKFLYVVGSKILVLALENETGVPKQIADAVAAYPYNSRCNGYQTARMTADGKMIYASGWGSDDLFHVGLYDRDAATGLVSERRSDFVVPELVSKGVKGGWYSAQIFLPPDEKQIYVQYDGWDHPTLLTTLARNSADGTLKLGTQAKLHKGNADIGFSPDGLTCYTAAGRGFGFSKRDPATGELSDYVQLVPCGKNDDFFDFVGIDPAAKVVYSMVFNHGFQPAANSKLYVFRLNEGKGK